MALIICAVGFSLLIGLPLGVLAGLSNPFDKVMQPVLDTMQTLPAFVYLLPVVLFFGIARVPAVSATVIYAVPPLIRLISHGIRAVPFAPVESARAFGATWRQVLVKVQMPLALPSVLAGASQCIMMSLGMVVIAAMVGAGGLGREVYVSMQRLQVGQAFEAGLAIVFLAIMLDRFGEAIAHSDFAGSALRWRWRANWMAFLMLLFFGILSAVGIGAAFGDVRLSMSAPVDNALEWVRDNLGSITAPVSDGLTLGLLNPLRDLLTDFVPWPVIVIAISAIAHISSGWKLSLQTMTGMIVIGLLGMWEPAMDTPSQILGAIPLAAAIAFGIGLLSSQFRLLRMIARPVNDFLQTIPPFVYLVPVIMLFDVGRVPGLIASVLYAIPVGIKLVELGILGVPDTVVDAARAFGTTRWQMVSKIQVPLARASLLLGLNQMILLILAMVVISGMVGGAGLGLEAVTGLAKSQTGRGIEAGISIMRLAIILDRLTQAWAGKGR